MKAVVVGEFGGPEQLRVEQVADPVPGHGQIRVVVHAAGVNPVDTQNRADGSWAGLHAPCILGYDIAGVVDFTGPGVTEFRPGDRVMAMTHFPDGAGGYAELAVVDAGLAAPIGPATSMTQAAAAPLAAGTAWTILARLALPAASRLLVLGASGGVGLFLLQLAAQRGIEVTAAGRQAMHQQMRALGAANCVDYTRENLTRRTLSWPTARSMPSLTWSADGLWRESPEPCGPGGKPPLSPLRNSTWTRCWTRTSPSTASSSKTTASGPAR